MSIINDVIEMEYFDYDSHRGSCPHSLHFRSFEEKANFKQESVLLHMFED